MALCVCLPEKMRLDGCQETLSVVQAISSPAARASALARLAAGLPGNCFHDQLVEMCQAVIRDLSMQPCKELLNSLGTLTPVLSFLGDDESIVDTYRAITDVTRWCP